MTLENGEDVRSEVQKPSRRPLPHPRRETTRGGPAEARTPSSPTRHLGRLPGGGSPEAAPANAGEGEGLALRGPAREGGTSQSWAILRADTSCSCPKLPPPNHSEAPHPCLRAGAVPGAVPTSQPILPVTSQRGDLCFQLTEEETGARRGLITSLRPHSSETQGTWHCRTWLGLWDILQKYSEITVLDSGRLFILNKE